MKKFIHAILSLIKTIGIVCLIAISLSKLEKEHYTPTDTPNGRFMVGGQHWQDFVDNPRELQTKPYGDCMDRCLKILENGNYQYINEGLQTEYSEYQIKDNTVIPVSFE